MHGPTAGYRFDCPECGYACARLPVAISATAGDGALKEIERAEALAPLRQRNFEIVLDCIAAAGVRAGARLLEVGSGHGWFLDAAARRGHAVLGIEPDARVGGAAAARGHAVVCGFFPQALPADARFDVVVFNDAFEHLPDPRGALRAVRAVLARDGLLAINLPSSRGAFYRLADALRRIGWRKPHDRMWQVGFPSPHLSYFHPDALARLAARTGFRERDRRELPSVALQGLWQRLRYDPRASVMSSAMTWLAVATAIPLLRQLDSDIVLQIFAPTAAQRDADLGADSDASLVTTATR
jgi:SAM-dependent methyltransferase